MESCLPTSCPDTLLLASHSQMILLPMSAAFASHSSCRRPCEQPSGFRNDFQLAHPLGRPPTRPAGAEPRGSPCLRRLDPGSCALSLEAVAKKLARTCLCP